MNPLPPVALTESSSQPASDRLPEAKGNHFPQLDGIRGLAIILVMAFHFVSFMPDSFSVESPVGKLFGRACGSGWIGVDLFFVLSGFLITGILVDTRESSRFFRTFYARRALRIFPLYYGLLVLTFLILPAVGFAGPVPSAPSENQSWFWLYGVNFLRVYKGAGSCGNLEHFWSLAVEEHFYLLWPVAVYYLSRKALMRICIVVAVLALGARGIAVAMDSSRAAYMLTPCRIDAMAAGAFMALAIRGPLGIGHVMRFTRIAAWLSGAVLLTMLLWHHGYLGHFVSDSQLIGYSALAIFFASLVLISVGSAPAHPLRRGF